MRHVTAAFAVEAKLVLDDLVGEAEEERIAVGLVVVRVPAGHHEHVARSMETFNVIACREGWMVTNRSQTNRHEQSQSSIEPR